MRYPSPKRLEILSLRLIISCAGFGIKFERLEFTANFRRGRVARFSAHAWKACNSQGSRVRIPPSPPKFASNKTLTNFGEISPSKNYFVIFGEADPPYIEATRCIIFYSMKQKHELIPALPTMSINVWRRISLNTDALY